MYPNANPFVDELVKLVNAGKKVDRIHFNMVDKMVVFEMQGEPTHSIPFGMPDKQALSTRDSLRAWLSVLTRLRIDEK